MAAVPSSLSADAARPSRAGPAPLFDDLSEAFLRYYKSPGGVVRGDVVRSNLGTYLPRGSSAVLDVGCGEGLDAIWLAQQGHRVTAIDPSRKMLEAASTAARQLSRAERSRLSLRLIDDRSAMSLLSESQFDVVLCHGVLMYQQDERAFLRRICAFVRPGGILSLLTRNAAALSYRAASEGNYQEAMRLLSGARVSKGRLGVDAGAHSVGQLKGALDSNKMRLENWFGVKIFSDGLAGSIRREDLDALLQLEVAASRQDPYRQTARLVHLVARRVE